MKKVIICALLLCVFLSACGQVVQGDPNSGTTPTSQLFMQHSSTTSIAPTTQPPVPTQPPATSTTYPGIREPVTTTVPTVMTTVFTISPVTNPTTVSSNIVTTITTKESTSRPIVGPTTSPPHPQIYFYTSAYSEYCKFLSNHEIADHIILLEELPYMGTFSSMQFVKDPSSEKEINYSYGLTTANGDLLSICFLPLVNYEEYLYPDKTDISKFASDSMLTTDADVTSGYVRKNDVVYSYRFGKLVDICWAYEGYVVNLDPPESWCDDIESIKNEPEFIRQLLHTDTIESAMQTFASAMAER